MIKQIKVTNSRGIEFEFGTSYRLTSGMDVSGLRANVNFLKSISDGSKYQNTRLDNRDIDIQFRVIKGNSDELLMDERRKRIYAVFNPKLNPMRIDFVMSDGKEHYITANLSSAPSMPPDKKNNNDVWQNVLLQFIATDPYIYEKEEQYVDVALWVGKFSFPLIIPDIEGIEMGVRQDGLIANVFNPGQSDTGMIIRFKALATVNNPSIININTYEELKLNTTMAKDDVIEVSTYLGKKTVTLIRDNKRTNIFNTLDINSKFLELRPGDNLFRYDADAGVDNLEMTITFRAKSVGV